LENHNDLRRKSDYWSVYQINVVEFLHKVCELSDQFTQEEIHSACGALDVNAYEIRPPNSGQQRILGLFPLASMMSHNCVSNMNHVIDAKLIHSKL
jgi:hypothetical protein